MPLAGGTSFPLLTFAAWEELPGIRHCFSTREGGVSEGWLSSLNLRRGLYDPDENVNENFRRIAGFFGVGPDRIVCAQQTHTSNVRIVTSADAGKGVTRERDYTDIDGLITDIPGIVLYTSHADCVPIYFYDPVRRVIALAHSGWKGTAARIGEVTIRKMQEIYGCRPEDIYAAVGPSICADCYEVSEDVADAMRTCFSEDGHETIPRILAKGKRSGHYQLDLWRACARILLESGICCLINGVEDEPRLASADLIGSIILYQLISSLSRHITLFNIKLDSLAEVFCIAVRCSFWQSEHSCCHADTACDHRKQN